MHSFALSLAIPIQDNEICTAIKEAARIREICGKLYNNNKSPCPFIKPFDNFFSTNYRDLFPGIRDLSINCETFTTCSTVADCYKECFDSEVFH